MHYCLRIPSGVLLKTKTTICGHSEIVTTFQDLVHLLHPGHSTSDTGDGVSPLKEVNFLFFHTHGILC